MSERTYAFVRLSRARLSSAAPAVTHLRRHATHNKLDRAYDDRLAGNSTDEMWTRKPQEWQGELDEFRREASRHDDKRPRSVWQDSAEQA